jgi:DNA-binding NtrC family response regulator
MCELLAAFAAHLSIAPLHAGLAISMGGNVATSRSEIKGSDGMKKAFGFEDASSVVLSISLNDEDCAALERILQPDWAVIARSTVASAVSALRNTPIPIAMCDCDMPGRWEEMLDQLSLLPDPPLIILTSRLADERLWASALNLGAWDVLAKPFDPDETIRIAGIARRHWQDRHAVQLRRAKFGSPTGTGYLAATGT